MLIIACGSFCGCLATSSAMTGERSCRNASIFQINSFGIVRNASSNANISCVHMHLVGCLCALHSIYKLIKYKHYITFYCYYAPVTHLLPTAPLTCYRRHLLHVTDGTCYAPVTDGTSYMLPTAPVLFFLIVFLAICLGDFFDISARKVRRIKK